MFCTRCGAELEPDAKFCIICGALVEDDGTQVTPNQPTTPMTPVVGESSTTSGRTEPLVRPIPPSPVVPPSSPATPPFAPVVLPDTPTRRREGDKGKTLLPVLVCLLIALLVVGGAYLVLSGKLGSLFGGEDPQASSTTHRRDDDEDDDEGDDEGDDDDSGGSGTTIVPVTPDPEPAEPAHVGFTGITSASATSTEPHDDESGCDYFASQAIDGDLTTCWAEGVPGNGEGESITLSGSGVQTFSGFEIYSGYHKTEEIYLNNARPTQIEVYVDGAYVGTYNLADMYGSSQTFTFAEPIDGTNITFKIASTTSGRKYADCSISEIRVF